MSVTCSNNGDKKHHPANTHFCEKDVILPRIGELNFDGCSPQDSFGSISPRRLLAHRKHGLKIKSNAIDSTHRSTPGKEMRSESATRYAAWTAHKQERRTVLWTFLEVANTFATTARLTVDR